MSKITNDGLIRSGTGCFTAVPIWQQRASKGYILPNKLAMIDLVSLLLLFQYLGISMQNKTYLLRNICTFPPRILSPYTKHRYHYMYRLTREVTASSLDASIDHVANLSPRGPH